MIILPFIEYEDSPSPGISKNEFSLANAIQCIHPHCNHADLLQGVKRDLELQGIFHINRRSIPFFKPDFSQAG